MQTQTYDWTGEFNKMMVNSLITTFGLDPMLFDDKRGGNVTTLHNVRSEGLVAGEHHRELIANKPEYDAHAAHNVKEFLDAKAELKVLRKSGVEIQDAYSDQILNNSRTDLDHIVSAKAIDADPARIISGLNVGELAAIEENLTPTSASINRSKGADSADEFEKRIKRDQKVRDKFRASIAGRTDLSKEEQQTLNLYDQQEMIDFDKMRELEAKANNARQRKEDDAYYASVDFAKHTIKDAGISGVKNGTKLVLGTLFTELWFELKTGIPEIYKKHSGHFVLVNFMSDVRDLLDKCWERIMVKMAEVPALFMNGLFSGVITSVTTTVVNKATTTVKLFGRFFRTIFDAIIASIKMIVFPPAGMKASERAQGVVNILSVAIAGCVGITVNGAVNASYTGPFAEEVGLFLGMLATGIVTITCGYFINHSPTVQKFWNFFNHFKSTEAQTLEHTNMLNEKLNKLFEDIAEVEMGLDTEELSQFVSSLRGSSTESDRTQVLKVQIEKMGIDSPFIPGDIESIDSWLATL
ncbi:hypothetical protein PQC07_gp118 [Aeromonas phage D3]|uniref:Cobalamin adenosyltransferase n=1 Tax=Aeromonas phage D3 TaxID=2593327 RepID=A0A514TVV9_9CAUD|nr:hypothetical protein PQC07_gp118 [Aeromonas phage D3]QDJ97155.1 hypothetical protein D3_0157 [Aeromonas phage D3]